MLRVAISIRTFDPGPNYPVRPEFSIKMRIFAMKALRPDIWVRLRFQIEIVATKRKRQGCLTLPHSHILLWAE
jgi:hypothetical protein